jgi:uncharacterized membrane protein
MRRRVRRLQEAASGAALLRKGARRDTMEERRKRPGHEGKGMPPWTVILIYVVCAFTLVFTLPRLEFHYLPAFTLGMSTGSALAIFTAIGTGMLSLTAIVFSLSFVMVQFSSAAYSPRLVQWMARDPLMTHSTGIFTATFLYALGAAAWVDRAGTGRVPLLSSIFTILLLIASVFAFVLLIQRVSRLQINEVLTYIGNKGREVIAKTYEIMGESESNDGGRALRPDHIPVTQSVAYAGPPKVVAALDADSLVELARQAGGIVVLRFAVGSAVMKGDVLFKVYGAKAPIPEERLLKAVHLAKERTFEQDPKYALRLLVDVAIRALSPAVNDPTTAVQALDQVEDHLRRLGNCRLDVGRVKDAAGELRLTFPTPTWGDFLLLAFDEIRFYGATSVQVMRRMRNAMNSLAKGVPPSRRPAVEHALSRLDATVGRSYLDLQDRTDALQEDRQGLGLPDSLDGE